MKSELKQLSKDSIVYGIGGIIARGVGFFFLPIYTRIFSPAEYGAIETLTILNSFLSLLLVMGMDAAQSFYFFEQKKNGKIAQANVVTAILQWRLIWGSVVVLLATFLSPLFNMLFFEGQLTLEYFIIAFVGILFTQFMLQSAEIFRLLYRPLRYLCITLGNAVLASIISITLVVWLGWGIKGYFVGFCISGVISAVFGWLAVRDYLDFSKLHREWWPKLIKFGAPLIFSGLAMYALHTTDRWFIIHYHGQSALGIYAVGAKFVILISFAIDAFRRAWWPIAMDALNRPDGPELFRTVSRLYLGLGVVCVVMLTFLSPLLIKILSAHNYHSGYPIIGILSWHSIFYGFYMIVAVGIWKREKTFLAPIAMGVAVLINIVLDFYLVPKFGGMGAAIATSLSFFIWVFIAGRISETLWPVGYPVKILGLQISIGAIACWIILLLYQQKQVLLNAGVVAVISSAVLVGISMKLGHFIEIYKYGKYKLFGRG